MTRRPARPPRARWFARRRIDLLLGALLLAAAALLTLVPPAHRVPWACAWLAAAAATAVGAAVGRASAPAGPAAVQLRLLVLAVPAVSVLALLAADALPALAASSAGGPVLRFGAWAIAVVAAAARLPGWGPPLGIAALAAAFETAALALPAPGSVGAAPASAWAGAGVGLALLAALAAVAAAAFRDGARQRAALLEAVEEHRHLREEAETLRARGDERGEPEVERLSPRGKTTRIMSAVASLNPDLDRVLALAALAAGARSVVLFLLDEAGEQLYVRRAFEGGGARVDREATVRLGEGVVGHAARSRRPALFTNLDGGSLRPPLHVDETAVPSLVIVPVSEADVFRGVLVADAAEPGAFGSGHERILAGFAGEIGILLAAARTHVRREDRGHRLETLRLISKELSSTMKLDEMLAKMVDLARQVVPYDRCALYLCERERGELVLGAQRGFLPDGEGEGLRIPLDHRIPGYLATHRRELLFTDVRARHRAVEVVPGAPGQDRIRSFLGLPLTTRQGLVGVWVLVADKPGAFDAEHLDLLMVVAAQAATMISNAVLHQTVELLSVTDGLTGLYNHRRFQERLQHEIDRSGRTGERVSLLLLDIDHFKRINDAHGHPFGDRVLKALAAALGRLARRVDVVARYGGEEFAIVLAGTDRRGCRAHAERVLKTVRALRVPREDGDFAFTLSVGGATFPDDAASREELVRRADQALYAAKEGGRNRAVAASELAPAPVADESRARPEGAAAR
jgi:diguanylate cyclase (GGDEF)-like protein